MIDRAKENLGGPPAARWRARLALAPAEAHVPPTVSLVTLCRRDGGRSLLETVDAVLGQSLQAFEWLLLVDPGTPPAWLQAVEERASGDPRLRVIASADAWDGPALFRTAVTAEAPFVALLAPDEQLEPTALETLVACLAAEPALGFARGLAVVYGERHLLLDAGEADRPAEPLPGRLLLRREALAAWLAADPELAEARDLVELLTRLSRLGVGGAVVPEHLHWIPWRDPGERRGECPPPGHEGSLTPTSPGPDLPLVPNPLAPRRKRLLCLVPRITAEASGGLFGLVLQVLGRQGWQITVAALHGGREPAESALARLTPDLHVLERAIPPEAWPRHLRGLVASRRPEVVLFDGARVPAELIAHLRVHCGEPRYVALHHVDPDEPAEHGVPRWLGAPTGADVILASGAPPARADEHQGDLSWLPVCADTTVWQPRPGPRGWMRPQWGAGDDDAVVLFAAPLDDRGRLALAVEAFAALEARGIRFVAVIAGEGAERGWLEAEIARRNLVGRVHLPPQTSPDLLLRTMAAADVFFSPASAGVAVRVVQAMAMELPVVAAETAGQRVLVPPSSGRLVKPGPDALAGYVEALVTLAADPALRRQLGDQARRHVLLRLGPDRLAQQLEAAFGAPRTSLPEPPSTGASHLAAVTAAREAADRATLQRRTATLAAGAAALGARHDALARQLDHARSVVATLEARIAEITRAFEHRGRELRDAHERYETLASARDALEARLASERSALAARDAALADAAARLESLAVAHRDLQRERLRLAGELGALGRRWWRPGARARRVRELAGLLGRLDGGGQTS